MNILILTPVYFIKPILALYDVVPCAAPASPVSILPTPSTAIPLLMAAGGGLVI